MAVPAPWHTAAILIVLDVALCGLLWRTQPARLSVARFSAIVAVWIGLSVAATFASPNLMTWAYHLVH